MSLRALASAVTTLVLVGPSASAQNPQVAPNVVVKEDRPGLLARATIRPDAALRIALARVPGGRVREAEIEVERRRLVYSFEFEVPGATQFREVTVDAATGEVVAVEDEREDDEDADEDTDDDRNARGTRSTSAAKTPAAPARPRRS